MQKRFHVVREFTYNLLRQRLSHPPWVLVLSLDRQAQGEPKTHLLIFWMNHV